tara:strand:- start:118 stop:309 length:192 start_codon:yes stop_codon:yes gene_type:complete
MRGDSNMSDSSFMKSQKIMSKKLQKGIDNLDKEYRMREMRERWESGKNREKTIWEKIKEWITK